LGAAITHHSVQTQENSLAYNLGDMSLKELKKLERDVSAAITNYDARAKAHALAELDAMAQELGFSLAELTGATVSTKRKRAPSSTLYRNPENPAETWSGRGRKPRWFEAALASGAKVSELMA
jgi:DNA-binding protein H-NS